MSAKGHGDLRASKPPSASVYSAARIGPMASKAGSDMATNLASWAPRMLSVLRIMTGLLFLEHGTQKLLGFPPSDHGAPALLSLIGVQGILERVGGFLIIIGLFTRPVAFILSGDMAVAYFMAHAPKGFFPTLNGGARHPLLLRVPLSSLCRRGPVECG